MADPLNDAMDWANLVLTVSKRLKPGWNQGLLVVANPAVGSEFRRETRAAKQRASFSDTLGKRSRHDPQPIAAERVASLVFFQPALGTSFADSVQ
jgi:hypothetical protein